MLKWKIDVLSELKKKGYNTTLIRKEKLFGEAILTQFRKNNCSLGKSSLNQLCKLLECQPGDIIEYVPDED